MEAEPELPPMAPPLLTAVWIREHAAGLSERQLNGEFCVYCNTEHRHRQMVPVGGMVGRALLVPVGHLGARQLWACDPACAPARRLLAGEETNRP